MPVVGETGILFRQSLRQRQGVLRSEMRSDQETKTLHSFSNEYNYYYILQVKILTVF